MLWWRALGRSRSNAAKCFCSQVHEPVLAITPTYSHESCYEPHHQFPGPKWSFQTLSVFEITDRRTAPLYSFSPHKRRLWYSSNRYRKYTHFFDIDGVCRGRVFLSLGACCCTPDAQRVYIASKTDVEKGHLMTTIWDLTRNGSVEKYNHLTISEHEEKNIINKLDGLYLLNNKKILDFIRMFLGFISPLHALHYRNEIIKILSY